MPEGVTPRVLAVGVFAVCRRPLRVLLQYKALVQSVAAARSNTSAAHPAADHSAAAGVPATRRVSPQLSCSVLLCVAEPVTCSPCHTFRRLVPPWRNVRYRSVTVPWRHCGVSPTSPCRVSCVLCCAPMRSRRVVRDCAEGPSAALCGGPGGDGSSQGRRDDEAQESSAAQRRSHGSHGRCRSRQGRRRPRRWCRAGRRHESECVAGVPVCCGAALSCIVVVLCCPVASQTPLVGIPSLTSCAWYRSWLKWTR
jgi:hypothetical protein